MSLEIEKWYVRTFANGDKKYFFALEVLKNGKVKGKSYLLEADRPRAKAKAKTDIEWDSMGLKAVGLDAVPFDRFAA